MKARKSALSGYPRPVGWADSANEACGQRMDLCSAQLAPGEGRHEKTPQPGQPSGLWVEADEPGQQGRAAITGRSAGWSLGQTWPCKRIGEPKFALATGAFRISELGPSTIESVPVFACNRRRMRAKSRNACPSPETCYKRASLQFPQTLRFDVCSSAVHYGSVW